MKITVLEPLSVPEEDLRKIAKSITDKGHELRYLMIKPDIEVLKERVRIQIY